MGHWLQSQAVGREETISEAVTYVTHVKQQLNIWYNYFLR